MARTVLTPLASLQNEASAINRINGNFQKVSDVLDTLLSRDGQAPNAMNYQLDMNNKRIINLPEPASANDPVRLTDLEEYIGESGAGGEIIINVSGALQFDDVTSFEAATIADEVTSTVVNGYYELGDCPPMTLIRVGPTEPDDHYGKFQSNDGDWWELSRNLPVDLRHFGAVGDGTFTSEDEDKADNYFDLKDDYDAEEITIDEWLAGDGPAVFKWLKTASVYGVKATASSGTYPIFGVIVSGVGNLEVECAPNVEFTAVPVDAANKTTIQLRIDSSVGSPPTDRPKITWTGGKFNGYGLPYGNLASDTPWEIDAGDARGGNLQIVRFYYVTLRGVHFKGGTAAFDPNGLYTTPGYVQGDQGVALNSCKIMTMIDCHGDGLPDALVYPRTNADMLDPEFDSEEGVLSIIGCSVRNSFRGVYGKFSGGRVVITDFRAYDTWHPVYCTGEYTPQIGEQGTGYQPFDITINGLRVERSHRSPIEIERAQVGAISDVTVSDWGRRPDGESAGTGQYNTTSGVVNGSYFIPVIGLLGCQNMVINNVTARLRDWNGGLAEQPNNTDGEPSGVYAAFLEGINIAESYHNSRVGVGNTLASSNILISNFNLTSTPIVVENVNDVEGNPETDSSKIGNGPLVRIKNVCDDNTVRMINMYAPDTISTLQMYLFRNGMYQYVDGKSVTSAEGYGYRQNMQYTTTLEIDSGAIVIPNTRVSPLQILVDTEGDASTDNLDTFTGGYDGQIVVIRGQSPADRVVTIRNAIDNVNINFVGGGKNAVLNSSNDIIAFMNFSGTWRAIYTSISELLEV